MVNSLILVLYSLKQQKFILWFKNLKVQNVLKQLQQPTSPLIQLLYLILHFLNLAVLVLLYLQKSELVQIQDES